MLVSEKWVNEKGKDCREFKGDTYYRGTDRKQYFKKRKWGLTSLNREVWKYRNGEIPPGYAVVPVDGDWEDFSEENWICRSRAKNAPSRPVKRPMVEFKGHKYYRDPRTGYYLRKAPKHYILHRAVWEDHNGPIPEEAVIHHIDGYTENNAIENLQMFASSAEHIAHHHAVGIHNHTRKVQKT